MTTAVKIGPHTFHVNTRVPEYYSRVGTRKTPAFSASTQLVDRVEGPRGWKDTVGNREEILKDPAALSKVLEAAGIPQSKPKPNSTKVASPPRPSSDKD